jgi:hypothetical protein
MENVLQRERDLLDGFGAVRPLDAHEPPAVLVWLEFRRIGKGLGGPVF